MNIELTVWQFVRLMVWFEDNPPHGSTSETSAYVCWRDIWTSLDKDLAHLGGTDPEAYSDMMMDQQVTMADVNATQRDQIIAAFEGVIAQLDKSLAAKTQGKRQKNVTDESDDLAFEHGSLGDVLRKLKS